MAEDYDKVNKICSSGTMILWRRNAAKEALIKKNNFSLLDVGTGTGELALEVYNLAHKYGKNAKITAVDFSGNMIKIAKGKAKRKNADIKFEVGDATRLKYKDNSFDVVTSSFAIKNIDHPEKLAKELYRVSKKGGKIVLEELTKPDSAVDRFVTELYWKTIVRIGFIGNKTAYTSLKRSIDEFDKEKFCSILQKAGFKNVKVQRLFSGAAFLIVGYK